jgi:Hydantoinase B/oxoprolinase
MVANELRALQAPLKTAPITSPIPTTIPSSVGRCRYRSRSIAGSDMRLHFDSPPQVRAGINMIYTALLSSVYYAVKAVVDPAILPNSGLARPITVTAPLGTIMNATHPAAVNGRTST